MKTKQQNISRNTAKAGVCTRIASGFTLIEIVVVIAIIGILAAVAWPTYLDQVRKARRSDAKAMLQDVATKLEQFYLDNKTYTATMTQLGYSVDTEVPTLGDRWYKVSVVTPAPAGCPIATCYNLEAVPDSTKDQANDKKCLTLTFNSKQVKGASGDLGLKCW